MKPVIELDKFVRKLEERLLYTELLPDGVVIGMKDGTHIVGTRKKEKAHTAATVHAK